MTWPFVIAGGLVLVLSRFEILSAAVSVYLFAGLIVTAFVTFTLRQGPGIVADVKNHVAISGLAFSMLTPVALATMACAVYGWPNPRSSFFESAAQINATLLVTAGLTIAAPTAWRVTPQTHFAWVAAGPLLATVGLCASIAGAISNRSGETLLPFIVAPIPAILVALLYGAYHHLQQARGHPDCVDASDGEGSSR